MLSGNFVFCNISLYMVLFLLDEVIKERKESLKEEKELEKILQKRHLDFLDILLCAKVV